MKIEKYKKLKNGKYELTLENLEKIQLYEDTILKYELLLKKEINNELTSILKFDKECEVYYIALKYIKTRTRSKKEIYDNLALKNYNKEDIVNTIQKLEKQGYINDLFFAKSFLNNKLITTSNGPLKIKKELIKKGIKPEIIDEVLKDYDSDIQKEKIKKIMNRMIKSNKNKSIRMLKMKIITDLISQGFFKADIEYVMNEIEFKEDENLAAKEYEKFYKKLSRKYSGEELEFKIKQKMFQKGFDYK